MKMTLSFVHCVQESAYFAEFRSSHPEMFLRKGVPKICGKFTGEPPCRSAKYPVNFLHIFRTPFPKNIYEGLFLDLPCSNFGFLLVNSKIQHISPFHATYIPRSSHRRCSIRKCVLRNFAKFTGKQL